VEELEGEMQELICETEWSDHLSSLHTQALDRIEEEIESRHRMVDEVEGVREEVKDQEERLRDREKVLGGILPLTSQLLDISTAVSTSLTPHNQEEEEEEEMAKDSGCDQLSPPLYHLYHVMRGLQTSYEGEKKVCHIYSLIHLPIDSPIDSLSILPTTPSVKEFGDLIPGELEGDGVEVLEGWLMGRGEVRKRSDDQTQVISKPDDHSLLLTLSTNSKILFRSYPHLHLVTATSSTPNFMFQFQDFSPSCALMRELPSSLTSLIKDHLISQPNTSSSTLQTGDWISSLCSLKDSSDEVDMNISPREIVERLGRAEEEEEEENNNEEDQEMEPANKKQRII